MYILKVEVLHGPCFFINSSSVSSGGLRGLEHPPTLPDYIEIIPICASISSNLLLFLFDDFNNERH